MIILIDEDARIIQALADVATIGILQERSIHRGEVLTEQLQSALNSRVVIEQAKGVLAQLHDMTVSEAFELLRTHARRTRQRLVDVASAVVADSGAVLDLTRRRRHRPPRAASDALAPDVKRRAVFTRARPAPGRRSGEATRSSPRSRGRARRR